MNLVTAFGAGEQAAEKLVRGDQKFETADLSQSLSG
jgi:hypothetical protein